MHDDRIPEPASFVKEDLEGYSFMRPDLAAAKTETQGHGALRQYADPGWGLAISTYRSAMPLIGEMGLEAAVGKVVEFRKGAAEVAGVEVIRSDAGQRIVAMDIPRPEASRVTISATRLPDGDVAVLELVHPISHTDELEGTVAKIAASVRPAAHRG